MCHINEGDLVTSFREAILECSSAGGSWTAQVVDIKSGFSALRSQMRYVLLRYDN